MPVRVRVQRPVRLGLARRVADAWNQAAGRVLRDEAELLGADVLARLALQLATGRPISEEERALAKEVGVDLDALVTQYLKALRNAVSDLPLGSSVALDLGVEGEIHPAELAKFFEHGSAIFKARPHWWPAWRAVLARLPEIRSKLRLALYEELEASRG